MISSPRWLLLDIVESREAPGKKSGPSLVSWSPRQEGGKGRESEETAAPSLGLGRVHDGQPRCFLAAPPSWVMVAQLSAEPKRGKARAEDLWPFHPVHRIHHALSSSHDAPVVLSLALTGGVVRSTTTTTTTTTTTNVTTYGARAQNIWL
ncbi:uncharacterized protein LY79DRAFT_555609 [Colletotrichum navitas]|uniref:Uncharacterized protein n=1 Tax=Colletotrichum navitas TaxID=681940 RepID=A0AAD8PYJ2_9PEZI|nr:uncharacterized protein LY79DRAFT_555609 [Colletotrichum navitas]KAK1590017.1 hypothetical protein LY79DRAFT_555609 [Colletotrichum navitas]